METKEENDRDEGGEDEIHLGRLRGREDGIRFERIPFYFVEVFEKKDLSSLLHRGYNLQNTKTNQVGWVLVSVGVPS